MEAALRAIAEPRRRQILALVRANELSAGEIAAQFDVTWPAISQHLNVLKDAGLVNERRAGTRRLYRARPEGFEELLTFLEGFWDERLAILKREAELDEATGDAADGEGIAVVREVVIAASPETIWQFLVDPTKAVRWMGVAASLDAGPADAIGWKSCRAMPSSASSSSSTRPVAWSRRGVGRAHPDRCRLARRPSRSTWSSAMTARSCA